MAGPSPTPPEIHRWVEPVAVEGLRVVSGTGELLGIAVAIERDRHGQPKWLQFVETDGMPPRKVQLQWVRGVGTDEIRLAGPREGYHITRLAPP